MPAALDIQFTTFHIPAYSPENGEIQYGEFCKIYFLLDDKYGINSYIKYILAYISIIRKTKTQIYKKIIQKLEKCVLNII